MSAIPQQTATEPDHTPQQTATEPDHTPPPAIAAGGANPAAAQANVEPVNEFDAIIPDLVKGGSVTVGELDLQLASKPTPGVEVKCVPVRFRQILAMGRVLTGQTRPLDVYKMLAPIAEAKDDAQENAATIAAISNLFFTVPHSEDEVIDLVNALVRPVDELNGEKGEVRAFFEYMQNPDAEDVVKIFAQTYQNERERLGQLGKAVLDLLRRRAQLETTS